MFGAMSYVCTDTCTTTLITQTVCSYPALAQKIVLVVLVCL